MKLKENEQTLQLKINRFMLIIPENNQSVSWKDAEYYPGDLFLDLLVAHGCADSDHRVIILKLMIFRQVEELIGHLFFWLLSRLIYVFLFWTFNIKKYYKVIIMSVCSVLTLIAAFER